ncbi:thiamine phosphate synthase [Bacillus coahuilensis]|uniref:thiamine phosphate synthase n=1 Tax=Bacillus coahuilensis TaxID=408580 RepID=UPI0001850ED3|nr:thiamine phosphate synthase [Bacillus coahuilensis]
MQRELHVMTNGVDSVYTTIEKIVEVECWVDKIHIREKDKSARDICTIVEGLRDKGVRLDKLVINDRLDIALLYGLSSIHLPSNGIKVKGIRKMFKHLEVSRSVHSIYEAKQSIAEGADYIMFGHVFPTKSKEYMPHRGLNVVRTLVDEFDSKVLAVGGIHASNVIDVLETGVFGVAIMSGILDANNPGAEAKTSKQYE